MKDITFNVGKDRLDGTLFEPKNPKPKNPAVLFLHGWTSQRGRYVRLAAMLAEIGFICLTYDMRGHGTSDGDIKKQSRQDFINDALAAYDSLAGVKAVDANKISTVGSSFGSYVAAVLTSQRRIHSLILRVPANYPDGDLSVPQVQESSAIELLKWRYQVQEPQNTASLRALHKFKGKVLIIESGADEVIPRQTVQNFLAAVSDKSQATYVIMEGAPHSIGGIPRYGNQYNKIVCGWLGDTIKRR